jgi:bacterioferritin (cytochrome b1)
MHGGIKDETRKQSRGAPVTTTPSVATPNPWLGPLLGSGPPPLSERLIRSLEAQAASESHDLRECQQLAERAADPVVQLLIKQITEDGNRHHSLLQALVRRLEQEVDFVPSPTALPVPADSRPSLGADMIPRLRGLIRDEHENARHLRHLARQEPGLYDGLYRLLLETIARDAEKHALILQFVLRRVEASGGSDLAAATIVGREGQ